MNQNIPEKEYRNPPQGSFSAETWPSDAPYKLGTETKDGWKVIGLHETVHGYWYHVEPVKENAVLPDEDHPGLIHQDLLVPLDSPRVCNDDATSTSAYDFKKLGEGKGPQEPEKEVSI